jgi:hypothetical protein
MRVLSSRLGNQKKYVSKPRRQTSYTSHIQNGKLFLAFEELNQIFLKPIFEIVHKKFTCGL